MRTWLSPYLRALLLITLLITGLASAQQIDIHGPAGSALFGYEVIVLPNGNIVVSDPTANVGGMSNVGAVYLYQPDGTLVSTLVGSTQFDFIGNKVGRAQIVVLANGNFVVPSPYWQITPGAQAGAVTFGDANTGWGVGSTAVVSIFNSLIGSQANDMVGYHGVTALSDGNFVVASGFWSNGTTASVGAVTWGNGSGGASGAVNTFNSLTGASANDEVGSGGAIALPNGHYVVSSQNWNGNIGAATWIGGGGTTTDTVSASNSIVGTNTNDYVASSGVTVLSNGNYVVASPGWNGGEGAATWCNGTNGQPTGAVSASNSLVGTIVTDAVSSDGITALSNGNYVVASEYWNNSTGAVTWGSGSSGAVGSILANPSITGATASDAVGDYGVTALSNGNYVVSSTSFNGGRGAATWGNGATGSNVTVSSGNSLVGSGTTDAVGLPVIALSNGNYVVGSPGWNGNKGAATWGNGANGSTKGTISASNSLIGSSANDAIGSYLVALTNGNYVAYSYNWNGGRGAATWGNGSTGTVGAAASTNSLVGTAANDGVGGSVVALSNGNYAVTATGWTNGIATNTGASLWGNGQNGTKGAVTTGNSVYGQLINDHVGNGGIKSFANGSYAVLSTSWNDGGVFQGGAVTLCRGNTTYPGPITTNNSVLGMKTSGGSDLTFDYSVANDLLVVGRPGEEIVSLLRIDEISRGDFDLH
jgi:hypothetical protein